MIEASHSLLSIHLSKGVDDATVQGVWTRLQRQPGSDEVQRISEDAGADASTSPRHQALHRAQLALPLLAIPSSDGYEGMVEEEAFEYVVEEELQSHCGYNADDVAAVASEPASEAVLCVHHAKTLPYPAVLRHHPTALRLKQNLQTLQRTHQRPTDSTSDTACEEGPPW